MTQKKSKGGGVIRGPDDTFVAEEHEYGKSPVGVLEAELSEYLDVRGDYTSDFYNAFKFPQQTFVQFAPATFQRKESFQVLCENLRQSELRHVGELLTQIIQRRVSEMKKHTYDHKTSGHINTLVGFIIARKVVSYYFKIGKNEPATFPLDLDFNNLAGLGSTPKLDLYSFLKTDHLTGNEVRTYDGIKANLMMLGSDFGRRTAHTPKSRFDEERTSSYSDNDNDKKLNHVFERPSVATNKTKKTENKRHREVAAEHLRQYEESLRLKKRFIAINEEVKGEAILQAARKAQIRTKRKTRAREKQQAKKQQRQSEMAEAKRQSELAEAKRQSEMAEAKRQADAKHKAKLKAATEKKNDLDKKQLSEMLSSKTKNIFK